MWLIEWVGIAHKRFNDGRGVSVHCLNLISSLLVYDPIDRPGAKVCLKCKYFCSDNSYRASSSAECDPQKIPSMSTKVAADEFTFEKGRVTFDLLRCEFLCEAKYYTQKEKEEQQQQQQQHQQQHGGVVCAVE